MLVRKHQIADRRRWESVRLRWFRLICERGRNFIDLPVAIDLRERKKVAHLAHFLWRSIHNICSPPVTHPNQLHPRY